MKYGKQYGKQKRWSIYESTPSNILFISSDIFDKNVILKIGVKEAVDSFKCTQESKAAVKWRR